MQVVENPKAASALLERYRRGRRDSHPRAEGLHLTDLVGCSRRAWWKLTHPDDPAFEETDEFTLITMLGQGHHVLLEGKSEEPITIGGLTLTPDELFEGDELEELDHRVVVEYKTTRASAKDVLEGAGPWGHENYLDQLGGYCAFADVKHGRLHVFYLLGKYQPPFPVHRCWDFFFEEEELVGWVGELARRKAMIERAAGITAIPLSEHYAGTPKKPSWECAYCALKGNVCEGGGGERLGFFHPSFSEVVTLS